MYTCSIYGFSKANPICKLLKHIASSLKYIHASACALAYMCMYVYVYHVHYMVNSISFLAYISNEVWLLLPLSFSIITKAGSNNHCNDY